MKSSIRPMCSGGICWFYHDFFRFTSPYNKKRLQTSKKGIPQGFVYNYLIFETAAQVAAR